jgi:cytochrome c oxidase cbb3-type subunit 2
MISHDFIEKRIGVMIFLVVLSISVGGLVEIVPLFFQNETTEPIDGLKPLDAVSLEGRDIYIREGCNVCHSQMIRPLRAEVERYGHYSVAGELVYNHPHLWGSKRTGPDLARVGNLYSNDWHRAHLMDPRSVVPESTMPGFPWLFENTLSGEYTEQKMKGLRMVGVPYTDEDIAGADAQVKGVTEADALIQYLQQLGLLIKERR